MTEKKTRLGVSAFAIFVFVFLFGSNGVRYLVGLPAFFVIAAMLAIASVVLFIRVKPPSFRWYRLPAPLYWFMILATLSVIWSAYRFESLLGITAQWLTTVGAIVLAFVLTWHELLRTLASTMRWIIALSFGFELWVSLFVGHPITSWWVHQPETGKPLNILWWSRDLLFEGGPIQGILANSAMFGFIGLLALILFSVQLAAKLVRPFFGWSWVAVAVATLLLTRSATVWIALAAVAVSLGFALWGRRLGQERRMPLYATVVAIIALAGVAFAFARDTIFALLGKSPDMTGRT